MFLPLTGITNMSFTQLHTVYMVTYFGDFELCESGGRSSALDSTYCWDRRSAGTPGWQHLERMLTNRDKRLMDAGDFCTVRYEAFPAHSVLPPPLMLTIH